LRFRPTRIVCWSREPVIYPVAVRLCWWLVDALTLGSGLLLRWRSVLSWPACRWPVNAFPPDPDRLFADDLFGGSLVLAAGVP
jgi:hypothetical protein